MKKEFLLIIIAFFIQLLQPAYTAHISLKDGNTFEAKSLLFDNDILQIDLASTSLRFNRSELLSVSFEQKGDLSFADETSPTDLEDLKQKALLLVEEYPQHPLITVSEEGNYQHKSNGTNITRYRRVSYIVAPEALFHSQISLSFNRHREKIKIIHARSYSPEGVYTNLDPQKIKFSKFLPSDLINEPQELISFIIPKATVGSIIDYSYEIEEFAPFDKEIFQGSFYFGDSFPVGESTFRVSIPKKSTLFFTTKNTSEESIKEPIVFDAVDSIIYTWKKNNIEPITTEILMPPSRDIVPAVHYSLNKDFALINEKLKTIIEPNLELTQQISSLTTDLLEGTFETSNKIARIYEFCQKEIEFTPSKNPILGNLEARPLERILASGFANSLEKSLLMSVLLKAIEVVAHPVSIRNNDSGKSIRDIGIFDDNHWITEILLDGRAFYLDPTSTDYRFPAIRPSSHDTTALNPILGTINYVPTPPPEENAITIKRKIILLANGTAIMEFYSSFAGAAESSSRESIRTLKAEDYSRKLQTSIAGISGNYKLELATHTNPLDFVTPFCSKTSYTLYNYAPKSGKYMIFAIPHFELSFPEIAPEKRKYDIVYSSTQLRTEHITIDLPEGYSIKHLPTAIRVQSSFVEYEAIYDIDINKRQISIDRKLAFPRKIIPQESYDNFKSDLQKIANSSKDRILLIQTNKQKQQQQIPQETKE